MRLISGEQHGTGCELDPHLPLGEATAASSLVDRSDTLARPSGKVSEAEGPHSACTVKRGGGVMRGGLDCTKDVGGHCHSSSAQQSLTVMTLACI